MTETPTAAELAIPAESVARLVTLMDGYYESDDEAVVDARYVAAPVVAAELRAQAAFLDRAIERRGNTRNVQNINKAYAFMARVFRDRADELDPPARQED